MVIIFQAELRKLYKSRKLSIRKIAKILGCGAVTVQRRLRKYRIQARASMAIKLNIPRNKIRFLYEKQRSTLDRIAVLYNCSSGTIRNRLKEFDIKARDFSEAHIKYEKNNFSGELIEKAYLIGFRLGDLHIRKYEKNGKVISMECASSMLSK